MSTLVLSKEQLRQARLKKLCDDSQMDLQSSSAEIATPVLSEREVSVGEFNELQLLMFGSRDNTGSTYVSDQDIQRWHDQGFQFCTPTQNNASLDPATSYITYGLKQNKGGPCGILAAVQAEIFRELCFPSTDVSDINLKVPDLDLFLLQGIVRILERASSLPINLVIPVELSSELSPSSLRVISCPSASEAVAVSLRRLLPHLKSPTGCVLFLMSLILSRGIEQCKRDMDDPHNSLIGQFGHCNQDLINLLLSGRATSNVMDGEIPLGDSGLVVRGVAARTALGYLTHLEALRYCQVGRYLKVPQFPVWVVGSSSHFSVLFCPDKKVNDESRSERFISLLQRCFKAAESDECGYIPADKLQQVLEAVVAGGDCEEDRAGLCRLQAILADPVELARLRGHLRVDGHIIIWGGFWVAVSRLLGGEASLDSLISEAGGDLAVPDTPPASPPSKKRHPSPTPFFRPSHDAPPVRGRSDSELARELQCQLDGEDEALFPAAAWQHSPFAVASGRVRSDSELARELQSQWDSELDGSMELAPPQEEAVAARKLLHRSDSLAGEDAAAFTLFHYNGLETATRRATLTEFRVLLRSADDAVGQTIAFAGGEAGGSIGGGICPIEEVLHTRWPGCRLDWLGQGPPSID